MVRTWTPFHHTTAKTSDATVRARRARGRSGRSRGAVLTAQLLAPRRLIVIRLIVVDPLAVRRELAETFGATETLDPTSDDGVVKPAIAMLH